MYILTINISAFFDVSDGYEGREHCQKQKLHVDFFSATIDIFIARIRHQNKHFTVFTVIFTCI